jgi:hypothetical protein
MFDVDCGEILVCADCMHEHANGEYSPDRPADEPLPWSALPFGYFATMGGAHSDLCTDSDREAGCDCDDAGFCQTSCDGCGSSSHGDRYRFTLWRASRDEAKREHSKAIQNVREMRTSPIQRYPRVMLFTEMSAARDWRSFLARLSKEERDFQAWIQRIHAIPA